MKPNREKRQLANIIALLASFPVYGQGTFVYDQQSSIEGNFGEAAVVIQSSQLIGQSFTPTLSTVGFIRLYVTDSVSFNGLGATISVNLRSSSITGSILASTDPVTVPDAFHGTVDYFFATPVAVVPSLSYVFQPVLQSGDPTWQVAAHNAFGYAGGTAFFFGQPSQSTDLWFREGIVIPEPSSAFLVLAGLGTLLCARLVKHAKRMFQTVHRSLESDKRRI